MHQQCHHSLSQSSRQSVHTLQQLVVISMGPPVMCIAALSPQPLYGSPSPSLRRLPAICRAAGSHLLWQLPLPNGPRSSRIYDSPRRSLPPGVPTPVASLTCCPLSGFSKSSMAALDDLLCRSIAVLSLSRSSENAHGEAPSLSQFYGRGWSPLRGMPSQ